MVTVMTDSSTGRTAIDAEKVRAIISRYSAHTPNLAARAEKAGTAPDWDDIGRIPVLCKTELPLLQAHKPPDGGVFDTTFEPTALFFSPSGVIEPILPRAAERLAELLLKAGFRREDRVLNGFSYHFTPAGMLFHEALVRIGCCVLPTGPQNIELQAQFASKAAANAFVGIASHLRLLLDSEKAASVKIRVAMAGAEPMAQAIRDDLLKRHSVRCVDMYGFAEAGIIAWGDSGDGLLMLHDDVVAEVVDPATLQRVPEGEVGELVVSLDSAGFPLLRFATGDLVRLVPADPQSGASAERMVLLGRTGNSVRVKGMLLYEAQLRDFAHRVGLKACSISVSRDANGLDQILLHANAPGLDDHPFIMREFVNSCRLKAVGVRHDDTIVDGTFLIRDERKTEVAGNPLIGSREGP